MFASQIDDWPEVAVDDALHELWAELDAQCDPVWLAAQQAAIEKSLARQLIIDPDDGSAPLPEETDQPDEPDDIAWPSDEAAVFADRDDQIATLRREVARTRALLAGAVADRDDAAAAVEALRGQRDEARSARDAARTEVRVARHEVGMARAEAVRAVGERDLARADLAHATRAAIRAAADSVATEDISTDTGATGTAGTSRNATSRDAVCVAGPDRDALSAKETSSDAAGSTGSTPATGSTGSAGSGLVAGLADAPGPDLAGVLQALVGDLALTPGSGPVARVGCLDGLADTDVVEVAVAAQGLAAWAGAVQAAAAGHLRDRWAAGVLAGSDEALWTTAAEIGLACGLSRHAAVDLLNTTRHLPTLMPTLWTLFASGHLDLVKANLITSKTLALTPDVAAVVEAGLLDRVDPARSGDTAPITRPQLEALLDRLIAAAAPEAEEELAAECRARRGVRFRALAHGMGQMTLITGAEETEAARSALNDLTHAARARGRVGDPDDPHARCDPDGRHPSATRADVLSDLITGTANATCTDQTAATDPDDADTDDTDTSAGTAAATATGGSAAPDTAGADTDGTGAAGASVPDSSTVHGNETAGAQTSAATAAATNTAAGADDIDDADTAAGPAAAADMFTGAAASDSGGARGNDTAADADDARPAAGAAGTDTAATDSSDTARCADTDAAATDADACDAGDTGEALLGSVSQTVLNPAHPGPSGEVHAATAQDAADKSTGTVTGASFRPPDSPPSTRRRRRRTEIVVLVPLSVLTGQSEQPATLAGYGPIPAQLARELAAHGHWRCAVTDDRDDGSGSGQSPTHGTLLGLGRSTYTPAYTPGPGLRRFIEIRDETCVFPGCRHPASRSEHDHRIPWTDPTTRTSDVPAGATCDCNLQSLCVHHHRLKHRGGITVTAVPGGGTTWTMPTGRSYTTRPEPLA